MSTPFTPRQRNRSTRLVLTAQAVATVATTAAVGVATAGAARSHPAQPPAPRVAPSSGKATVTVPRPERTVIRTRTVAPKGASGPAVGGGTVQPAPAPTVTVAPAPAPPPAPAPTPAAGS